MIKGITARKLFLKFPQLKKKLWKGHLWNPSYYIETIGSISGKSIDLSDYMEHRKSEKDMIVEYVYRYRLYPNKEQEKFLNIQFGHCRFLYNKLLETSKKEFEGQGIKWNYYEYKKKLPQLKEEYPFLKEANSQSLQESVKNLNRAYKSFFKGEAGFPKFKKKKPKQTVHIPQYFAIEKVSKKRGLLKIPKLKTQIPIKMHRNIEGQIRSITKTPDSKYYLNVLTKREIQPLKPTNKTAGIDMGIKEFVIIPKPKNNNS